MATSTDVPRGATASTPGRRLVPPAARIWRIWLGVVVGLAFGAPLGCRTEERVAQPPRHALHIVVDALRADMVGPPEEPSRVGSLTPYLDLWVENNGAVAFDGAWAQSTWTLPSYVSYMTSTHVRTHGWAPKMGAHGDYTIVPRHLPLLAEVLAEAGFHTTAYVANVQLDSRYGFDRGFERYELGSDEQVVASAAAAIQSWRPDSRQYLYVHLMGPHVPLEPSREAWVSLGYPKRELPQPKELSLHTIGLAESEAQRRSILDKMRRGYRAVVWDVDRQVMRILAALRESGHEDDTLVVFHSDHGEQLAEPNRSWGHGRGVFELLVHVPLILRVPGSRAAAGPSGRARLLDVPTTLVAQLGLGDRVPSVWQGVDLLVASPPFSVSERDGWLAASRDRGSRAVWRPDGDRPQYFDLTSDPGEYHPLAPGDARLSDSSRRELEIARTEWAAATPEAGASNDAAKPSMSAAEEEEFIERLRALGYVE